MIMSQENKEYIVQLVKQVVHPYFAGEIADILIAHGMTFKTEPMTNADKIRSMSDEELADILREFCKGMADCIDCPFYGSGCPISSTFNDWVKWLQQPAEVDDAQE